MPLTAAWVLSTLSLLTVRMVLVPSEPMTWIFRPLSTLPALALSDTSVTRE